MISTKKKILFRTVAVVLGLVLVGLLELALRLADWGNPDDVGDPFVGFSEVRPLFVLNDSGDRREIPKSRQYFFRPESFAARKSPAEYRIFCLGGSTVQGRPYAIETSFTSWLELNLKAADPSREWDVINCGGVSYASYRLLPIMEEVLSYEPDLFIVYTGHNEFLEDREYTDVRESPAWLMSLQESVSRMRIYGVLRQSMLSIRKPDPADVQELNAEVDALLDHEGEFDKYDRDDQRSAGVVAHLEHNLRRLVQVSRDAGVRLIFVNPVSNLRDTRPFKSQHRPGLSESDLQQFDTLLQEAVDLDWNRLSEKERLVDQLIELDDRYADLYFLRGHIYAAQGRYEEAEIAWKRAKDEDVVPLRMLESMHDVLQRVARQTDTPLIDVRAMFEAEAEHGIPGNQQLVDHVHPGIDGHQKIADLLFNELIREKIVTPASGWEDRREALYRQQWDTLSFGYFSQGKDRLKGLQEWATGRADEIEIQPEKTD